MSWLVVKFDAENTVEAVPNTWYIKEKLQCYWPSGGTSRNNIIDFIKKKRSPQANWILYDASILGCYGTVFLYAYIKIRYYNIISLHIKLY